MSAIPISKMKDGWYFIRDGVLYQVFPKVAMPLAKKVNVMTGEVIYPTNADRIRQMTDEELADWIDKVLNYHTKNVSCSWIDICDARCPLHNCCNGEPNRDIAGWLKKPGGGRRMKWLDLDGTQSYCSKCLHPIDADKKKVYKYCPWCGEKREETIMDRCVMCGAEIPEGRQVCPQCEYKVWSYDDSYEMRYWLQNMTIAKENDAKGRVVRAIEWIMKHPMLGCKLCKNRDAECSRYGVECHPVYDEEAEPYVEEEVDN